MRLLLWLLLRTIVLAMFLALGTVAAPNAIAAPPPCADLVITNFTVTPTDTPVIVAGRNAQVAITVLNQGTCESLSFTVQWLQDNGGLFTPPAGPATHQVGGLAAGASTTINFEFAYPQAGDFTSVATLDTTNTVAETNESNNVDIEGVRVWANQPDLVVTGFAVIPATPAKGEETTIRITVLNEGTANAGPFVVQWSQDDTFSPPGPSEQVASLAAGESTVVEFSYAFQEARNYNTVVRLDTSNTVAEWNETNNMAIYPVTVIETAPDLVVTNFTITPINPAQNFPQDQPVAGLNALIEITVKNQGADPAGTFVVQWRSDIFAATGPSQQINGLGPDESVNVSFEYAFPNAGNFTTVATVDSDNNVAEANESNNLQIKSVTVQAPVVDLVLTKFTVAPAPGVDASIPITPGALPNPVRGRLSLVTIVVENRGNSPAGSFRVSWEPQPFAPSLSKQINSLNYDESVTVTYDFTYPQAGFFFTTAKVDDLNQVFETNEGNNNQVNLILVEEQLPDLIVADIEFLPAQPVQNTPGKARVTVINRGNTAAGPFQLQLTPAFLVPPLAQQINGLGVASLPDRTAVVEFDLTYGLPGTFAATAVADVTNVVVELDEGNNSRTEEVTVQVATQDLIITSIRIEEETCDALVQSDAEIEALIQIPAEGDNEEGADAEGVDAEAIVEPILNQNQPYQICVTVQNLGNSAIGPFVVSADPDAFDLIVPSLDTLTEQIDEIGAGQETVLAFNVVYPQQGNFRINALVDAFNNVFETNENNNLFVYNVKVEPTGPDLVISELVIGNNFSDDQGEGSRCLGRDDFGVTAEHNIPPYIFLVEPRLGEDVSTRICIVVTNEGSRDSGAFLVEWNADTFELITSGPTTLSKQIGNLEPGESRIVEFYFAYVQVGTFHTVAKADAHEDVAELNEENNLAIADVVVDTTKPDLVIDELTIAPRFAPGPGISQEIECGGGIIIEAVEPVVIQGRAVEVCILVRNAGGQPSGPFVVAWNPDTFGLLVPSAGTLSTQVDNLNPGESAEVRMNFEYNQFNEFRTIAQVDFFNTVEESVEGNNEEILNVVVDPAPINLTVEFESITPNEPDRGSAIVAEIEVCETQNEYPTEAFTVEWRPTGEGIFNPTARIEGLLPGRCQTVTLTSTILIADVYTSIAVVDLNDEIIETNESEADNTDDITIDVQPRITTLEVSLDNILVRQAFEDSGSGICIDCDGEWEMLFAVLDLDATGQCNESLGTGIPGVSIPIEADAVRCTSYSADVQDGNNFDPNRSLQTTLVEWEPLVLATAGIEDADLPFEPGISFVGAAFALWLDVDYLNVNEQTTIAVEGDCSAGADEGECFDLTYTVTVIDKPAPLYLSTAAAASTASAAALPQTITLPDDISKMLPTTMVLPDGILRADVPWIMDQEIVPTEGTNTIYLPHLDN